MMTVIEVSILASRAYDYDYGDSWIEYNATPNVVKVRHRQHIRVTRIKSIYNSSVHIRIAGKTCNSIMVDSRLDTDVYEPIYVRKFIRCFGFCYGMKYIHCRAKLLPLPYCYSSHRYRVKV